MSMAIANLLNAEEFEPRTHVQTAPRSAHDAQNTFPPPPPFASDDARASPLVSPSSQPTDLGDVAVPSGDEMMGAPPSPPPAARAGGAVGASSRNDIRSRKGKMSEQKRKQTLAADELVLVLSAHRVRCRSCQNELQLSRKSKYDLAHWYKHRERCVGKGPQPKKGRRASKASLPTPPRSRFTTPESTPPFGHSATASNASTTPDPAEVDPSATATTAASADAQDKQGDDVYFGAQQRYCADVFPPCVRATDPDFADGVDQYQVSLARAQRHDPPRASDWSYSCLRRGPWSFSPIPGVDDGRWLAFETGGVAPALNTPLERVCPY